ncbi:MAG: nitroreductase [Actinomycetota bacterium]
MPAVRPSPAAYRHALGLRVVRCFHPNPIPPEEMEAMLEAGRWTGSSKNRQGWAFVVVDDRAGLERLATAGSFTAPVLASAATVVLIRLPGGNDFDIGRVAQNVMLAAAARGLGSCPITLHDRDRAREVLALPEGHEGTWAVALGYPDEDAEVEQRRLAAAAGFTGRRPLAELVHRGRFGGPPT